MIFKATKVSRGMRERGGVAPEMHDVVWEVKNLVVDEERLQEPRV